ncbi:hypothetical protein ACS86_16355 [Vibrio alginolyticus]|nr:hypothetical protein ACS86_16355 [Vibrio alginolyticus]
MIKSMLLVLPVLALFSSVVYSSAFEQELLLQDCPTEMVYSYPSGNGRYSAYTTDKFDFSSAPMLVMSVTFQNLSSNTWVLGYPQVWTNRDNAQNSAHSPYSSLEITPEVVQPGEEFTISGVVDILSVPATDNILTIRPQLAYKYWTIDVEQDAPIVRTEFICLPPYDKERVSKDRSFIINGKKNTIDDF